MPGKAAAHRLGSDLKPLASTEAMLPSSSDLDSPVIPRECHQGQGKVSVRHVQVEVSTDEEIEQFIIDAELLARLPIVELLRRAAQKYGYVHQGAAAHH
jgi:hypothetical protein